MKVIPHLVVLFAILGIGCDTSSSADDCYKEIDTAEYKGPLGDWHRVGILDGEVNQLECFTIDTSGISDIINSYSFTIGNMHYESGLTGYTKCTYQFSRDYKTLYYYNYDSNSSGGDTLKMKVARLDSDYMVLIFPAKYEGQKTMSQLYQRK